ncbi:unnamed protein product [Notodromas monacha]|uniref:Lysophospholipid acyltransferase 5 n=1 Tax=Notodromas monacha TaxID=399045 RepID=A0A7R9BEU6_9CRUS|nr:unnamed protein product [Notodromas monacha]CAG0913188.1 unnamed protein product [Notodromas monacha]
MSFAPPDVVSDRIWGIDPAATVNASLASQRPLGLLLLSQHVTGAVAALDSAVASLATLVGTSEPSLRLLLALLVGYPIAVFHRLAVSGAPSVVQNAFFFGCGVVLGVFTQGWDVCHALVCILVQYLVLVACGKTYVSPLFSVVFQLAYLLFGYWQTETEDYNFSWTLSHCVLTLRLIGIAFDYYDGQQDPETLSKEQKLNGLRRCPSFLELGGHALFPASFLVGPQFPMKRYKFLIRGDLKRIRDSEGYPLSPPLGVALGRLVLGLLYTGVYVVGSGYMPVDYAASDDLLNRPLWQRLCLLVVWAKVSVAKYLSCWLITEGACILSGLSFNGFEEQPDPKDPTKTITKAKWDGCRNIHVSVYETATEYQHMILCFNTNTNAWVANYIYKRMKFLNKKHVSHMVAMAFLAVWHGLNFSYYVTFFNEYIIISRERDFYDLLDRSPVYKYWFSKKWVRYSLKPLKVLWLWFGLSYAVIPFLLLSTDKWWRVYTSLYFHIHVVFLSYPFLKPSLKKWLQVPDEQDSKKKD